MDMVICLHDIVMNADLKEIGLKLQMQQTAGDKY